MGLFGDGGDRSPRVSSGVEYLKELWGISDEKPQREMPPSGVNTNIYATPDREQSIPRRHHTRD